MQCSHNNDQNVQIGIAHEYFAWRGIAQKNITIRSNASNKASGSSMSSMGFGGIGSAS